MKKLILFALSLFYVIAYAQKIPVVNVDKKPLGLSSLDIDVVVTGNIATTTYDMLFYNPTNAVLEGELDFPLGDGFSVSRFALDINGKLREAVVVDKELGRIAFEAVVRRRVDPALLEKGTGNNYKARIYPIPAKGYKRIVLAYEQELKLTDGNHYYDLPLAFKNELEKFDVSITVLDQATKPIIEKGSKELGFTPWQQHFKTSIHKENYKPDTSIRIQIPINNTAKQLKDGNYVYVYKPIQSKKRSRKKPQQITLFWDTSLSMKERDLEKEIKVLDAYFKQLQSISVNLITFSNSIQLERTFTVQNGNWKALQNTLENVNYDGGTDYAALASRPVKKGVTLLSTDGMFTLSKLNIHSSVPVFTINSMVKSNHPALRKLASETHGAYINLSTATTDEAMALLSDIPFKYLGYKTTNKQAEIYPNTPTAITNDFSVAAKGVQKGDKIVLQFGYGKAVTKELTIEIDDTFAQSDIIQRLWAKKKLDKLTVNAKENKDAITSLGTNYQLVTDYTSLIVLDDIMDYVRYKIAPPEELREEYDRIIKQMNQKDDRVVFEKNNIQVDDLEEELRETSTDQVNKSTPPPPPPVLSRPSTVSDAISVEEDKREAIEIEEIIETEDEEEYDRAYDQVVTERSQRRESRRMQSAEVAREASQERISNKYRGKLVVKDRHISTPYLKELREIKNVDKAYEYYLIQRISYQDIPSYYIDVANFFIDSFNHTEYARRIVSNIPEIDGDNYELLKVFGYQMQVEEAHEIAAFIFERILELRPEDSQSYRDLAIAYENIGKCQEALDLLTSITDGSIYENNHRRIFNGIKTISENEIKHLVNEYREDLVLDSISKEYKETTPYDIRVVVDWNHNDTDIDLHIIDPNLEECYYNHSTTKIGGQMSQDMTQGFGPEEYTVKKAIKGDYFIKVRYYGNRYQKIETPTFMKVTIFKYYGTNKETKETKILRLLKEDNEEILAKISF